MGNGIVRGHVFSIALSALLLTASGCAFFQSSGSSSDSSGSVSDSLGNSSESSSDSSRSSSDGDTDRAYHEEVRAFTVAHVHQDGGAQTLRLGLAEVALARGISDWEALPTTFAAIGAGLAEAGVDEVRMAQLRAVLASPQSRSAKAFDEGYADAMGRMADRTTGRMGDHMTDHTAGARP